MPGTVAVFVEKGSKTRPLVRACTWRGRESQTREDGRCRRHGGSGGHDPPEHRAQQHFASSARASELKSHVRIFVLGPRAAAVGVLCRPQSPASSRAPFSPLREDGPAAFPERQGALAPTLFHPTPIHPRAQPGPEVRIYDASTGKLIRKGAAGPGPPGPPQVHAERPAFRYVRARAWTPALSPCVSPPHPLPHLVLPILLSCLGSKTGLGRSRVSPLTRPARVPGLHTVTHGSALHKPCAG